VNKGVTFMNKLKYASSEQMYEGVLVKITGGSVTIDIKGRLGQIKLPLRMIISECPLEVGQTVGFLMSYPEVIDHKNENLNAGKESQE